MIHARNIVIVTVTATDHSFQLSIDGEAGYLREKAGGSDRVQTHRGGRSAMTISVPGS